MRPVPPLYKSHPCSNILEGRFPPVLKLSLFPPPSVPNSARVMLDLWDRN